MLVIETGYFSLGFKELAETISASRSRSSAPTGARALEFAKLAERLAADKSHEIKAVLAVHNETATGMVLPLAEVRRALDQAKHPALLLSDTISSLGSMEYKMDAWGIDVTDRRQPEGPDAADRHGDHRRQQQGARGLAQGQAAQVLLQLGADGGRASRSASSAPCRCTSSSACRSRSR